ncbi:MAG: hypothetical protein TEF_19540 [Rhizobiales bacterium NRL2]|jgi:putative endonuclease|nr:MAG: hypothetical protein TEF_19540 [Rhizobiales bacterium NRL2]
MVKAYYVYILANARRGAFYVGVTSDLIGRCHQHKAGIPNSFTNRYSIKYLIWYESHGDPESAIRREKRIKRWTREQKTSVIEAHNPEWRDLSGSLGGAAISECPVLPDPRVLRTRHRG